jgi:hypothetical protein
MLENFTVIEIVKQVGPLVLIIEPTKLRQTKGVVEALEYAPLVRYLLDKDEKRLAIQIAKDKDPQAVRFSKPKEEQKSIAVLYQNAELLAIIRGVMPEWNADSKYSVTGVYSKNDKAVIFDLKKAEPYPTTIGSTRTRSSSAGRASTAHGARGA